MSIHQVFNLYTIVVLWVYMLKLVDATVTQANITACFNTVTGTLGATPSKLLFPNSREYIAARRGNNARSLDYHPVVIVEALKVEDVQASVKCGKLLNMRVGAMAGGHSYEIGYGTDGIMVFLNDMNNFVRADFESDNPSFTVESGIRIARLYGLLLQESAKSVKGEKFLISSGTFFDVGAVGHGLCGGYGTYGRKLGLLSDLILEFEVVDGNGNVLIANSSSHPDLYWALRGACSTAFGIITKITYKLYYHPSGLVTHVSYDAPTGLEYVGMEWASRCSPFLPDEISVIYNLFKGNVAGIYMGTRDEAVNATFDKGDCGFKSLGKLFRITNDQPRFFQKTIHDSVLTSFSHSAAHRGGVVATLEDLLNVNKQMVTGSRYFMFDLVFDKPMPMEAAKLLASFYHSGKIGNFGFKARNGVNARAASDGKLYSDDRFGPTLRGMLYEIHIGTSSDSLADDNQTISNLLDLKNQLRPYLYDNGEYAYIGYIFFGGQNAPSGKYYYGETNARRMQDIRITYDPSNIFGNRISSNLYPVPSDPLYGSYYTPSASPSASAGSTTTNSATSSIPSSIVSSTATITTPISATSSGSSTKTATTPSTSSHLPKTIVTTPVIKVETSERSGSSNVSTGGLVTLGVIFLLSSFILRFAANY